MDLIHHKIFLNHDTGMHPENKKRLEAFGNIPETPIENGESYLNLIHSREYIDFVKQASLKSAYLAQNTPTSQQSYEVACYAVGATIQASETNNFALARPPGHHAHPRRASGFCIFNNIAIATQRLVEQGKRVLVFDFDGHLGDGIMDIFYSTDQVLYWSIHQYPAFPGRGFVDEIGKEKGLGYTINVPLPPGSGDDIFIHAVEMFLPLAEEFNPDVVALAAGFDAYQFDLLLELRLSMNSFHVIGRLLSQRFKAIFATLEGGYHVEALPRCIDQFLLGINGLAATTSEKNTESGRQVWEEYELRVHQVVGNLSPYWKSM